MIAHAHPLPGQVPTSPTPAPPEAKRNPSSGPLDYLSASRLKCWQECRLKFRFRYLDRIKVPTAPKLFAGSVIHAVLQAWNLARWRSGDTSSDAMGAAFHTDWVNRSAEEKPLWEDTADEHATMKEAWDVLTVWLAAPTVPLDVNPLGVEVSVTREQSADGLPPLLGVLDLVLPGGRIIDFKSVGRKPEPSMVLHLHQTQLACYALLYRDATGETESSLELHHLVKGKSPSSVVASRGPADLPLLSKLHVTMRGYVDGIRRADWSASPGQHCAWCEHRALCENWEGARP